MAINREFYVLIVEDDPVTRLLLTKTLTKAGYYVTAVENGRKALDAFAGHSYSIVLTDWIMPEMDGLGLCRAIRERQTDGYVFVILLTGKNAKDDIVSGFEAGVDDYLTKPINPGELLARLNTAKRILQLEKTRKTAEIQIRQYSKGLEVMVEERTWQLKNSEEKYRTILKSIEDGYYEIDLSGSITFINDATSTITGYRKEELIGMDATRLTETESVDSIYAEYRRVLSTGLPVKQVEWIIRNKSGSLRYLDNSVSLMRDSQGLPCGFRGIVRDVTEKKEIEKELIEKRKQAEAASRAKSEFVANLSHEIRTPLNGIIGLSELAMETCKDHDQLKFLKLIESEANSLYGLINNILDFSKIEAKRMELEQLSFNLKLLVEDINTITRLRSENRGLTFSYSISPKIPLTLMGDPGWLRQILINLLVNALKFTHSGSIELKVELLLDLEDEVKLLFSVKDTGIGIAADKQPLIFEPFTQADGSTTRKYGGTGLGTTISKQLVELMGGEIGLESELGKGSTFWFSVPMKKDKSPMPRIQDIEVELHGLNILMVRSGKAGFSSLKQHLTSTGCHVSCVSSASRALSRLTKASASGDPFGLIITGNFVSELNGFELSKRIRMDNALKNLPIILLTSSGKQGDVDRCKEIGINGYLSGQTEAETLVKAVKLILSRTEGQGGLAHSGLVTRHTVLEAMISAGKARILLAEDYPTNQQLAMRHLSSAGYDVDVVENGQSAIEAFEKNNYDLILMDMQMPVLDGYTAVKTIRAMEENAMGHPESHRRRPRIPIIATTAHAMEGDRELCIEAGMDDYLIKPLKKNKLLSMVQKWLEKPAEEISQLTSPPQIPETPSANVEDNLTVPMDFEKAIAEFEGDEQFFLGVLKDFFTDLKKQIKTIGEALLTGNAEVVSKEAHAIKGGAADVTAGRLSSLAHELEKIGKTSMLAEAKSANEALRKELSRLEAFAAIRYPGVFDTLKGSF